MDILPQQFKALMEMLRTELTSLRESVEKSSTAVGDHRIAQNESEQYEGEKISHAIDNLTNQKNHVDKTTEANQERRHRQNLCVQWVLAIATILAFTAASIYAWIAHDQLCQMRIATEQTKRSADIAACALRESQQQFNKTLLQMRSQTNAQKDSAKAALNSVKAAQEQMRLDQRAWVGIKKEPVNGGTPILYVISLLNTGKSPARNVVVTFAHYGAAGEDLNVSEKQMAEMLYSAPAVIAGKTVKGCLPFAEGTEITAFCRSSQIRIATTGAIAPEIPFNFGLTIDPTQKPRCITNSLG